MAFQTGTATDYKDLLDKLVSFCTGNNVTAAAIQSGGTGYTVNDILTVTGGTSSFPCTLKVTAVSGGVITGIRVHTSGAYTANPSNPVAVTGGTGANATFNLTLNTGNWDVNRSIKYAGLVTIQTGGTGYAVGNILTVAGGTRVWPVQLLVTSVSSGVVTGVSFYNRGNYSVTPANPVSVTGGAGSNATFVLTWEEERLLQGIGSGADEVYVGFRTYQDLGVDAFNWEVAGMTGYSAASQWDVQPGINPGRWYDTVTVNRGGSFVPLDDASMSFWFNQNGRRIIGVVKCGTGSYMNFYAGFVDPFNTTTEYPYPLFIGGSVCRSDTKFNSTRRALSGYMDPRCKQVSGASPFRTPSNGQLRYVDGSWLDFYHTMEYYDPDIGSTTNVNLSYDRVITPPWMTLRGASQSAPNYYVLDYSWQLYQISPVGQGGTATYDLRSTPGATESYMPMFPCTLFMDSPADQFVGQLSDTYWICVGGSSLTVEDELDVGTDSYIIFRMGNQTENYYHFALKRT